MKIETSCSAGLTVLAFNSVKTLDDIAGCPNLAAGTGLAGGTDTAAAAAIHNVAQRTLFKEKSIFFTNVHQNNYLKHAKLAILYI